MLKTSLRRPVALHELHGRSVAGLAVRVVVHDGDDDGEDPDERRPVGVLEGDGQRGGEAGPDDDKGAVEEAEGVDVHAVGTEAPAGWWEGLALDALEEDAACSQVSRCFE